MEKKTRAGSLGGAKASFQILISVLFLSSSHLFTIYLSLILGGNFGHENFSTRNSWTYWRCFIKKMAFLCTSPCRTCSHSPFSAQSPPLLSWSSKEISLTLNETMDFCQGKSVPLITEEDWICLLFCMQLFENTVQPPSGHCLKLNSAPRSFLSISCSFLSPGEVALLIWNKWNSGIVRQRQPVAFWTSQDS